MTIETRFDAALAGRYVIDRELGAGGMATVYLASERKHGRQVAIKLLRPELAATIGAERFLLEIEIAARLQHPHILALLDSGEADGFLYYVMPFVDGESLRTRLDRARQLDVSDALAVAREVADALHYAHECGVVHRDIKPENILLSRGHAMVADFGIARAIAGASAGRTITATGTTLGTASYMSPEQAGGADPIDGRSDIYSLASVLYEMLAGEPPFTGQSVQAIIAKRFAHAAPSIRIVRPGVSVALDAAIARGLAREPADRYRTAADFARALHEAESGTRTSAASESPAPSLSDARRSRGLPGLALLAAGALLAVGLWLTSSRWLPSVNQRGVAVADTLNSIAVLPMRNVGGDSANAPLADGMTYMLGSALAQVPGLRVVPRTVTGKARDEETDPRRLGESLHVSTLLRGGAQRIGRELRVTLILLRARDGSQLWTETFPRSINRAEDVFLVQDDIVRAVVAKLQVRLAASTGPVAHRTTENLDALNDYLRGKLLLRRPAGAQKSLEWFTKAIEKDSGFAEAYAGLADANAGLGTGNVGDFPPEVVWPRAHAAAMRAIALDSTLAAPHGALAYEHLLYDFDWAAADTEIARALALNPSEWSTHYYRAILFEWTGRFEEAVAEAKASERLDPTNAQSSIEIGRALLFARRYPEAIAALPKVLEIYPGSFRVFMTLGQVYEQMGQLDSAIVNFRTAYGLQPSSRVQSFLAHAYAKSGQRTHALALLDSLRERGKAAHVAAFNFALVYEGLGDRDQTFAWLNRALDDHSMRPFLMDPTFDDIRGDVRYAQLMHRMNLPWPGATH